MTYQLYRNTTLGNTLQESLDELVQYGQITPTLAKKVLLQFDKCINNALATRVRSRLTFKAGKLNTYRFCDNVWTFMLNDVEFREVQEVAKVDKVKIVACDGKRVIVKLPFTYHLEESVITCKSSTGGEYFRCKDIIIRPLKENCFDGLMLMSLQRKHSPVLDLLLTMDSSEGFGDESSSGKR